MSAYAVIKWLYIPLSYVFSEPAHRPVRPTNRLILRSDLQPGQAQNQSAPGKAEKWASGPKPLCSYQVSSAQNIHNSDDEEND
jgi:hypothetical protein